MFFRAVHLWARLTGAYKTAKTAIVYQKPTQEERTEELEEIKALLGN